MDLMRSLILTIAVSTVAQAATPDYLVGTAQYVEAQTTGTTTATCSGNRYRVDCNSYTNPMQVSVYYLTSSEGFRRRLNHAKMSADPLKALTAETKVRYRLEKHAGVTSVYVLAADGKEGRYYFSTRDDDPNKKPERQPVGPAPVE